MVPPQGPGWGPTTSWLIQTLSEASPGPGLEAHILSTCGLLPKLSSCHGRTHHKTSPPRPLLPRRCCHCATPGQELRGQEGDTPPQHQLLLGRSVLNSVVRVTLLTLLGRCLSKSCSRPTCNAHYSQQHVQAPVRGEHGAAAPSGPQLWDPVFSVLIWESEDLHRKYKGSWIILPTA